MKHPVRISLLLMALSLFSGALFHDSGQDSGTNVGADILTLDDFISRVKSVDSEYANLLYTIKQLQSAELDLYRSFLPQLQIATSGSNTISTGSADATNYTIDLTLSQVLYDQVTILMKIKNFELSRQEQLNNLLAKEKAIVKSCTDSYVQLMTLNEQISNKEETIAMYAKVYELAKMELEQGTKTKLDVVETEQQLISQKIELEKMNAERELLVKDLNYLMGEKKSKPLRIAPNVDTLAATLFSLKDVGSLNELIQFIDSHTELYDIDTLYIFGLHANFDLRKIDLQLAQNRIKRELLQLQYLKNISLSVKMSLTGDKFPPVNATFSLSLQIALDFGFLTSNLTITENTGSSSNSSSGSASGDLFSKLSMTDVAKQLELEAFNLQKKKDDLRRGIMKSLESWTVNMKSQLKILELKKQQRDVMDRKFELMQVKMSIGEVKEVDYLNFLLERDKAAQELIQQQYSLIQMLFQLEEITGRKIRNLVKE